MSEPSDLEVRNYTIAMQRVDAILGKPIRIDTTPEEYEAQRDELAELLEARWRVFA